MLNDLKSMTKYERYKLAVDFMRFLATMGAPFIIVALQYILRRLEVM
jgi:hypothetical protein